ncbi:S24 family peptidase [Brevibacillus sp. MER 51]|uniref:LexA family protein n=1 Tax=Brevibacillus sp. MER 51 TaxID=2939560 RepID=UPI00203DABD8|nr:S24 family peptidase [Brevibacillus sp. MER 51]MCM3141709.1 helix-turn-helix domain-containing protein [Brevibacillus sp. MER 51]
MLLGKVIAELRNKKGLTQDQMADILGIKRARYNSWENNFARPDIEMVSKLADYHKVSVDYLLGRQDYYQNVDNDQNGIYPEELSMGVPLVGTICAGDGLLAQQNIEQFVQYPLQKNKRPDFALRVQGQSMQNAGIDDGDIVFMRKAKWAEYNGQIVAAIINGEDGTLKRIKWSVEQPFISLIPENDDYATVKALPNDVVICGVYAGHFKPEKEQ